MKTVRDARKAAWSAAVSSVLPSPWESPSRGASPAAKASRFATPRHATHLGPSVLRVEHSEVVVEHGPRPVWDARRRPLGAAATERAAGRAAHERDALARSVRLCGQPQGPAQPWRSHSVDEHRALCPRRNRRGRVGSKNEVNDPGYGGIGCEVLSRAWTGEEVVVRRLGLHGSEWVHTCKYSGDAPSV